MTSKFNCDCGFEWEKGRSGQHNCSPFYREIIDGQQQEIAKLKLSLSDLNEHDDEITGIETTNQELSTLAERENDELKAQVELQRVAMQLVLNTSGFKCSISGLESALNKTPAQCLQSEKADAVEGAMHKLVDQLDSKMPVECIGTALQDYANKLRECKS